MYFTTGDKSLRLGIWNSKKNKSELREEYESIIKTRDDSESKTQEVYDFSDADYIRIGYSIKETDENKIYDVIYGFTIIEYQVIVAVFYYDNEKDKQWAIETWKKIKIR